MALTLAGRTFDTTNDLRLYVQMICDNAELGEIISDDVVLAVLRLHPDWPTLSLGMTAVAVNDQKQLTVCVGEEDTAQVDWRSVLANLSLISKVG